MALRQKGAHENILNLTHCLMPRQCVRLFDQFDRLPKIVGARDVVSVVGVTSTAVVVQPQHFGTQRFAILLTALSAWSVKPDLSPAIFAAVGVSAYLSHFGYSIVPGDSLRVTCTGPKATCSSSVCQSRARETCCCAAPGGSVAEGGARRGVRDE